jgi:methyl-accepting chemotaxis protein I, serine sensor receptor
MRNLGVKTGLLAVMGVFTLALLLAVGVGWRGTQAGAQASENQASFTEAMLTLKQAEIRMWDNRVALAVAHRNLLRGDAPASVKGQADRAEKAMADADKILTSVVQTLPPGLLEQRALADSMLTKFRAYTVLVNRGGAGLTGGNEAEYSGKDIVTERNKLLAEMEELMQQLFKAAKDRSAEQQAESVRLLAWSRALAVALLVLAVALVVGSWLFINRRVVAPLQEVSELMDRVAQGDLTTRIDTQSTNEIGRLLRSVSTMQAGLASMVTQVRQGVEEINTGAREIALGNSDLSGRTEQQAASLEETAASMEELSSTVKQNADNARQANQLASGSMDVAQRGGAVVDEVVATMKAISGSSAKMADIVNVIDSIAFQTNILALNAAVEAARAGEQGRGFAVVASEVRALAQRSAAAAKEIKDLIADSAGKVGAGSAQVERAGATMQDIVASVRRVTDIMGEISAASIEQSSGIDQVNLAVAQMDQATQQNAALVEQASAAASSLEDQAQRLNAAVAQFKVDMTGQPVAAHRPARRPPVAAAPRPALSARAPAKAVPAPAKPAAPATRALGSTPSKPAPAAKAPAGGDGGDWESF